MEFCNSNVNIRINGSSVRHSKFNTFLRNVPVKCVIQRNHFVCVPNSSHLNPSSSSNQNNIQDGSHSIDVIISKSYPINQKRIVRCSVNHTNLTRVSLDKNSSRNPSNVSDNLIIASFNAQSLGSTCYEKRIAVYDFISEYNVDILLLQETWFKDKGDEGKISELTPNGFITKSHPRSNRGGGLAVVYRNTLSKYIKIKTKFPFSHTSFECMQISLNLPTRSLHLWNMYRTCPSQKNKLKDEDFFTEFSDLLNIANTTSNPTLIIGDFNFHFNKPNLPITQKLNNLLDTYGLSQSVSKPTHKLGNILDAVVFRENDNVLLSTTVNENLSSDHFCVVSKLDITKPSSEILVKESRNIKRIDRQKFLLDLNEEISLDQCNSFSQLNENLLSVLNKHAPLVCRKVKTNKNDPWFDDIKEEVTQAKRKRRGAEKRKNQTGLIIHKQIYNEEKKKVTRIISNARTNYYSGQIENCSDNRKLYGLINTLIGNEKCSPLPTNFDCDQLPQIFSEYFLKKISDIRMELDQISDLGHSSLFYSTNSCSSSFSFFHTVSEDDVRKTILHSKPTTCILDPIPTPLLKEFLDPLLPIITKLLNDSLCSGVFPENFKSAIVKPLLKKSTLDQNILKNYRPVSNLPFFSKILEKLVLQQLFEYLNTHSLLSPNQSAYRPSHSTETALLKVMNDLLIALDNGDVAFLTLLDLSAAFDTIDHSLLFQILSHSYGISGTALSWIKTYLLDRSQSVVINNHLSSPAPISYGVPQGSVLGPILFIMYTQSLHALIKQHSLHDQSFADDTQVYHSCKPQNTKQTIQSIQGCLTDIKSWMIDHKLKLNDDKTEALLIYNPRLSVTTSKPSFLTVGSSDITFSSSARNLGFIMSYDLSVDEHISHICKCAYSAIRQISSIRKYLTINATKSLVCSLVLSRLDYSNSLLANCPKKSIHRLQNVQNAAVRLTLKLKKYDHITQARKQLHWLPIEARITYKLCLYCHYFFHCSPPAYIYDLLSTYIPPRSLRSSDDHFILNIPSVKTCKFGERAFSYAAPKSWNTLPLSIRQQTSTPAFKRSLKTFLFQKCYS